jgi:hypothetical protein
VVTERNFTAKSTAAITVLSQVFDLVVARVGSSLENELQHFYRRIYSTILLNEDSILF